MGSVVVTPRFYSIGSIVAAQGPSCSASCGTFPEQGSNTCLLHRQVDSLPLSHQGSLVLYLLTPIPHCLNYYSFMSLEIRSFRTFNLVLFFSFFKPQYSSITPQLWRFLSSYYSVCGPAWGPSPTQNQATQQIQSGGFLKSVESEPCEKDDLERAFHRSSWDTRKFFFKVLAILGPFLKLHINFTMRYSSSTIAKQKPTGILLRTVDQFELPRRH